MYKLSLAAIVIIFIGLVGYNVITPKIPAPLPITDTTTNTNNQASVQLTTTTNASSTNATNTNMNNTENKSANTVTLNTTMGVIVIELSKDKPITTSNFTKLTQSKYYDGVKFHRVIDGFMIQAGDPNTKDDTNKETWGQGGPGYNIKDELTGKEKYTVGTVAMANTSRPNTGGSQFFIMLTDYPLPPSYTVFGKVVSGLDNVLKIGKVPTELKGIADRPIKDVSITTAVAKN